MKDDNQTWRKLHDLYDYTADSIVGGQTVAFNTDHTAYLCYHDAGPEDTFKIKTPELHLLINIIEPHEYAYRKGGDSLRLRWIVQDTSLFPSYDIKLYDETGVWYIDPLAIDVSGSGSGQERYLDISTDFVPGNTYTIRVGKHNYDDLDPRYYDEIKLSIVDSIRINSPNTRQVYAIGETIPVNFDCETTGNYRVRLIGEDGLIYKPSSETDTYIQVGTGRTINFEIPTIIDDSDPSITEDINLPEGDYRIRVMNIGTSIYCDNDQFVRIQAMKIVSPNSGENWSKASTNTITFRKGDIKSFGYVTDINHLDEDGIFQDISYTTIRSYKFFLINSSGVKVAELTPSTLTGPVYGIYTATIPTNQLTGVPLGDYYVRIISNDQSIDDRGTGLPKLPFYVPYYYDQSDNVFHLTN